MARSDILRLPAGERLALVRAAKGRAAARLKAAHRAEYDALVEDELAHPQAARETADHISRPHLAPPTGGAKKGSAREPHPWNYRPPVRSLLALHRYGAASPRPP